LYKIYCCIAADRAGVSESDRRNFKFLQGGKKEKYEGERRKKKEESKKKQEQKSSPCAI